MNSQQRKLVLYSGLGGLLEFYDFIIFALLAPVLATQFFPMKNHFSALLATFATFSVGFLVRPIGGVIFAHFGDKYGRKKTFTTTIILMACSTFAIGLIPSYQSIGVSASIALVTLRIFQGLSVGSEIPGAITYVSESTPKQRSFTTAVIFFFLINGITLGSFLHGLATNDLSHSALMSWGWRCLFFIGGCLGFVGFILRRKMVESPLFLQCQRHSRIPFFMVLRESGFNLILTSLIAGLGAAYITTLYLFLPTYFKKIIHFMPPHFSFVFTLTIFIGTLCTLLLGAIGQKINKPLLIALLALVGALIPIGIFKSYIAHQYIYGLIILSGVMIGALWGVIPAFLAESFPTHLRYSGIAICYNLAFAIFGGLSPLIAIYLIKSTGQLYSPAYYLIALASIAFFLSIGLMIKQRASSKHSNQYFEINTA